MARNGAVVRVLHVGPEAGGRGGLGTSILRLLRSPLATRYELGSVATWRDDAGALRRILIFAASLFRLARWCLLPGPRIAHVHAAIGGSWYRKSLCILLARLLRCPVVLQIRVGPGDIAAFDRRIGALGRAFFRFSFASANEVLTVSRAGAAELERRYGLRSVAVVPNPPPDVPHLPACRTRARPSGQILYLGGFRDPAKGAETLLAALPDILAEPGPKRVVLAGPGRCPELPAGCLGDPAIRVAGWLDERAKGEALSGSDIFVLPSLSEGMPNTLMEAMAYGSAIVATPVGGVPDLLDDGVNALLVPPGDPQALAAAVRTLLSDHALRRRLGRAAHDRYRSMTPDMTWDRLDDVYRKLVGD